MFPKHIIIDFSNKDMKIDEKTSLKIESKMSYTHEVFSNAHLYRREYKLFKVIYSLELQFLLS